MVGWAFGMVAGTIMAASQNFVSVFPLNIAGYTMPVYAGLAAMLLNLLVTVALTGLFRLFNVPTKQDATSKADYEATPVLAMSPLLRRFIPGPELQPAQPQPQPQPQFQSGPSFRAMDPSMFSHDRQPPVRTSSPQLPPPSSVIGMPSENYRPTKRY